MIDPTWENARIETYLRALPIWRQDIVVEPLIGGLVNKSFVAKHGTDKLVARIGSDIPIHGIIQTSVQAAIQAASDVGITPALQYSEPGLVLVDFLKGHHLDAEDIEGNNDILQKVVGCVKRLHESTKAVRAPMSYFWPFQLVRRYADVGQEMGSRLSRELPDVKRIATALEQAVTPFRPVPTHNDVAPQNLMLDVKGKVWLVDWDYGGYGHPLFDVVGISTNADASDSTEDRVLELYYGEVDDRLRHQVAIFKLILNLREYMWSMIQELTSKLDRDSVAAAMTELFPGQEPCYAGYTDLSRARFETNWEKFRSSFGE